MARRLLVNGVDRLGVIPQGTIRLTAAAFKGEAGEGGFDLDDDAAALTFPGLKIVTLVEDGSGSDKTLIRGRVWTKGLGRGSRVFGDARAYNVSVRDSNADLRGLRVHAWSRPSESDRARVQALGAYILNGSSSTVTNARKRASTVIDVSTYVPNTNLVTMPARVYDATDPAQVLDDCARASGKDYFVIVLDDGTMALFYDVPVSTAYASTLSITDSSPDLSTSFPPIFASGSPGTQDPSELLSGGALIYADGVAVTEFRSGIESAHDVWETTYYDNGATNATEAGDRLDKFLDERQNEETRYTCAIEVLPAQAHLIKAGMTLSFRSAACGITSPIVLRVSRCRPRIISPGVYRLELDLSFPEKLSPRIRDYGAVSIKTAGTPDAGFSTVSASVAHDNFLYYIYAAEQSNWTDSPSDLLVGCGTEYDIYDVDADAVCGATTQYRKPYQRFGATLLSVTGLSGEPVRLRARLGWSREDPPLGPRPLAKQWMPFLITFQVWNGGQPVPLSTLYAGTPVAMVNSGADSGVVDMVIPFPYTGTSMGFFFVFIPLWSLSQAVVCGHPDDWGASMMEVQEGGGAPPVFEEIGTAGWVELRPMGLPNGVDTTFSLSGDVAEVDRVTKNGLEVPDTDWTADVSGDAITFATPPKPTDLVIVRYRVQ